MEDFASCAICIEEFDVSNTNVKDTLPHRLPCSHIFHKACVSDWLKKQSTCPVCRTTFQSKENIVTYDPIITNLLAQITSLSKIKQVPVNNNVTPTPNITTPIKLPINEGSTNSVLEQQNSRILDNQQLLLQQQQQILDQHKQSQQLQQQQQAQQLQQQQQQQHNTYTKIQEFPNSYYFEIPVKVQPSYNSNNDIDLSGLLSNSSSSPNIKPTVSSYNSNSYSTYDAPKNKASYESYGDVDLSGLLKSSSLNPPSYSSNPPNTSVSKLNQSIKKYTETSNSSPQTVNYYNYSTLATPPPKLPSYYPPISTPVPNFDKIPHHHNLTKTQPHHQRRWRCNYCNKDGWGYSERYRCNVCSDFDLCRYCVLKSTTITTPPCKEAESIMVPRIHTHPLYIMLPTDIYGSGCICDKCKSYISNQYVYHCTICTDYDMCSKCFSKSI